MDHPVHPKVPHQMNRFARNRRLYDHLMDMGLTVAPVLVNGDSNKIDALIVGSAAWRLSIGTASDLGVPSSGIGGPVKGPEVADVIGSSVSDRGNVVDFPAKFGIPVAMLRE